MDLKIFDLCCPNSPVIARSEPPAESLAQVSVLGTQFDPPSRRRDRHEPAEPRRDHGRREAGLRDDGDLERIWFQGL